MSRNSSSSNKLIALSLVVLSGCMVSFPYVYKTYFLGGRNITKERTALPGQTIVRGAYVNSGSKDIGPDPDWKDGTWRGRKSVQEQTNKMSNKTDQQQQQQ
jgi:hypothetical protein